MLNFTHLNAATVDEAASLLAKYNGQAKLIAGGTDLLGLLENRCLPEDKAPKYIINLKTVDGLEYIKVDGNFLKIGALAKLHDIAFDTNVLKYAPALAAAARKVASWQIRNMGTIAGNICQGTRCWYYRATDNRFDCSRKGGSTCFALTGNMREHSVFGGTKGCFAAHPSDTAPALVALGATIVTNKASYAADKFFDGFKDTVLAADEIVTEIQVPAVTDTKQAFCKAAVRGQIDFAMADVAVALKVSGGNVSDAVIVTNCASTLPVRLSAAEDAIKGKSLTDANIEAAAAAGVAKAQTINETVTYKKAVVEGLIKRALAACK